MRCRASRRDRQSLAGQLRRAVGVDRIRRVVLGVGAVQGAVEDLVRGDLDGERTDPAAARATAPARFAVDLHGALGIPGAGVDIGPGRGIDHDLAAARPRSRRGRRRQ